MGYVGRQGCHHLRLPQLSVGLGATSSNRETKHHAYSLDYYSSFAKTRTLDASENPVNKLKINIELNQLDEPEIPEYVPDAARRLATTVEVQSRGGSNRPGSSLALTLPLSLFSVLQLGERHLEGHYYKI